jgi:hypothetical protein
MPSEYCPAETAVNGVGGYTRIRFGVKEAVVNVPVLLGDTWLADLMRCRDHSVLHMVGVPS